MKLPENNKTCSFCKKPAEYIDKDGLTLRCKYHQPFEQLRVGHKYKRNAPCACGSGKKDKFCHKMSSL